EGADLHHAVGVGRGGGHDGDAPEDGGARVSVSVGPGGGMMPGAIGRGGRMAGLLMALAAATAVGEVPPPGDVAGIRNAVEDLAELPGVRPGTTGFYLAWLDAPDRPLAERDSRRSFLPA